MSSKLSTRARTLSQRRRNNIRARSEGHDLSGQDVPLNDRDSWVVGAQHKDEDLDDYDDEELDAPSHSALDSETGINGESRGRNQEPVAA